MFGAHAGRECDTIEPLGISTLGFGDQEVDGLNPFAPTTNPQNSR